MRKDVKLPPIGATPNFNSHMSVIAPKERDDIEVQFDHSQIYLYEMEVNKTPIKRPRHCLPYAVVSWLKFNDGTEWPLNFNEIEITVNNHINGLENGVLTVHTNGINGDHHNAEASSTVSPKTKLQSPNEKPKEENAETTILKTEPNSNINEAENDAEKKSENNTSVLVKEEHDESKNAENNDNATSMTENTKIVTNENSEIETVSNYNNNNNDSTSSNQNVNSNENNTTTSSSSVPSTSNALVPTTASPNTAGISPATSTATPTITTNPYQHHKTSLNHYQKSSYSYRPNSANLTPYLYAAAAHGQHPAAGVPVGQQFHPYGTIRLPYGTAQQIQALQGGAGATGFHANPYQAAAAAVAAAQQQQQQQQQQMFLIRTPNGKFLTGKIVDETILRLLNLLS